MDINNIEEDKTKQFIKAYEEAKAQSFIIESMNKDFFFEFADCLIARIKELEEEKKNRADFQQKYIEVTNLYLNSISKQKVKDVLQNNRNEIFSITYLDNEQFKPYTMQIDRINKIEKELLEEK